MSKILKSLLLLVAVIGLSNCAIRFPVGGSLYTNVTENATLLNKDASQKEGIGNKEGEACSKSIMGIIATGDGGIKAAAASAGINQVKSMDIKYSNVLGSVFVKSCTRVYGD